ncbi:hypothetical protein PH586_17865 [Pseudomonas sp. SA3-5]|uniref:C2H2-type domain-containing protein n=1 Tax=Pseudomonas aestuarii TaxID=3018340 RepID=A0ABT4XJ65_9PSED|nr:hypothetical protein [Pseudomonas aestuarii]MDA7088255.1 hypothetical protein [Pseudomonas aestuarii]
MKEIDKYLDLKKLRQHFAVCTTRQCKVCGTSFEPRRANHELCSHVCAQRIHLARKKLRASIADHVEDFKALSELLAKRIEELADEA